MRRIMVLGCCAILLAVGCQRSVQGSSVTGTGVESLPLSVQDVRRISGFDEFVRVVDDDQLVPDTYTPEGPCRALFDQAVAFGGDWLDFRTVADEGDLDTGGPAPLIASASQTIVAYPDSGAARAVFDRRLALMSECAGLGIQFIGGSISRPSPATVVYASEAWTLVSTIKSTVIVDVSVGTLTGTERIAGDMTTTIVGRISW